MRIVKMKTSLTTYKFYFELWPQILNEIEKLENGEDFILDFSDINAIDGTAIPNLLNVARIVIRDKNIIPQIYIANVSKKNKLTWYLEWIGFFGTCDFYQFYEVNTKRISAERKLAEASTYVFVENAKTDSEKERSRIETSVLKKITNNSYYSFWKKWVSFNITVSENELFNCAEKMTRNLCVNTGIHTEEYSILVLQANEKNEKILISVADCGKGFYTSFCNKKVKTEDGTEKYYETVSMPREEFIKLKGSDADLYAIVEALCYRFGSNVYGLYHVLLKTIEVKGTLRIHSNKKRVVLTANNCKGLEKASTVQKFATKLLHCAKSQYVSQDTYLYPGVHIELEIPYVKEKVSDESLENRRR